MEQQIGLTVAKNGQAQLDATVLMDAALYDLAGPADLESIEASLREDFEGRRVEVEEVEEGRLRGVRVVVHFPSAREAFEVLREPQSLALPDGRRIEVPSAWSELELEEAGGWLGRRYRFVARLDKPLRAQVMEILAAQGADDPLAEDVLDLALAGMRMRFRLTLPGRVDPASLKGPAALSEDGRTVTWTLPLDRPVVLEAAATSGLVSMVQQLPDEVLASEWGLPLGVGVGAGLLAGLLAWRLVSAK
ncbi:hypothetical protein [Thermaerobacter litoralis]